MGHVCKQTVSRSYACHLLTGHRWPRGIVRVMCSQHPAALLADPMAAAATWRRLEPAMSARPDWAAAVSHSFDVAHVATVGAT